VKQFTSAGRVWGYCNGNDIALQERRYENPTVGIVVVQVRRVRAISGDVFQRTACAALVKRRRRCIRKPGFPAMAERFRWPRADG
jgi:hypothetical protein